MCHATARFWRAQERANGNALRQACGGGGGGALQGAARLCGCLASQRRNTAELGGR